MDYMSETAEARVARLEYENDELTRQINSLERSNGRLRAEMEELSVRLDTALDQANGLSEVNRALLEAQERLDKLRHMVCAHSDSCIDFEQWGAPTKVYLADD